VHALEPVSRNANILTLSHSAFMPLEEVLTGRGA
jgi:hypothetical protein